MSSALILIMIDYLYTWLPVDYPRLWGLEICLVDFLVLLFGEGGLVVAMPIWVRMGLVLYCFGSLVFCIGSLMGFIVIYNGTSGQMFMIDMVIKAYLFYTHLKK